MIMIWLLKPNLRPNNRDLKQKVYIYLMKKSKQAGDPEVRVALFFMVTLVHQPYDVMHKVETGRPPPSWGSSRRKVK